MPSLHDLALTTRNDLHARYATQVTALPDIEPLAEHTRTEARVTVNMRPDALLDLLERGHRLNAFDRAGEQALTSGRTTAEVLQEHLGRWFARRTAFEAVVGPPGGFHYGAMSLGGLGAPAYGPCCAVFHRGPAIDGDGAPTWLHSDSLRGRWWSDDGRLDLSTLGAAAAIPGDGHRLAALKLTDGCPVGEASSWHGRLCSSDDFVEGLCTAAFVRAELETVRLDATWVEKAEELAIESQRGVRSIDDRLQLTRHAEFRDKLEHHGIPCVEVNP